MSILSDLAGALSIALFNSLWLGLILVAVTGMLLWLLGLRFQLNAATRYGIWFVTLLVLPVLCFLSAGPHNKRLDTVPVATMASSQAEAPAVPEALSSTSESFEFTHTTPPAPAPSPTLTTEWVVSKTGTAIPERTVWEIPFEANGLLWLCLIWAAIAGWRLSRLLGSYLTLRRLKRTSRPAPARYRQSLVRLMSRIDRARPAQLAISDEISMPMVLGLDRPLILIPTQIQEHLNDQQWEQVFLHELAHIQRRDDWTNLIQKIIEALFFFHPGVWWIGRQLNQEREFACDAWVLALSHRPKAYAGCLARLLELRLTAPRPVLAPGIHTNRKQVFDRVRTILDPDRWIKHRLSRSELLAAGLVLSIILTGLLLHAPVVTFSHLSTSPARYSWAPAPSVATGQFYVLSTESEASVSSISVSASAPVVVVDESAVLAPVASMASSASDEMYTVETLKPAWGYPDAQRSTVRFTLPVPPSPDTVHEDDRLSKTSLIRILKAAQGISSSGDRARLLTRAIPRLSNDDEVMASFLASVATIASSGDRSRVLVRLIEQHELSEAAWMHWLKTVRGISSSGSRARLLIKAAPRLYHSDPVWDTYLDVAESISSSRDRASVLSAALKNRDQ